MIACLVLARRVIAAARRSCCFRVEADIGLVDDSHINLPAQSRAYSASRPFYAAGHGGTAKHITPP
jgi:hypothetical protein